MTSRPSTRLIIVASPLLYREAWRALLSSQPHIQVVGTAADVPEVAAFLQPNQPTTILVDLLAPEPALARRLKAVAPEAGLLFLVHSYQLKEILQLLQAEVSGCVSRDETVGDLARAIIAVGRGEIALPPHIAGRALAALARGGPSGGPLVEPLSERETEVLSLLAQGLTNKDIAQTLVLSVRTVEAHLRNIYGKLGVHSRTEAALWAVKHGYGGAY
jgi:DNA-binding NarL/FixJ family response regulator